MRRIFILSCCLYSLCLGQNKIRLHYTGLEQERRQEWAWEGVVNGRLDAAAPVWQGGDLILQKSPAFFSTHKNDKSSSYCAIFKAGQKNGKARFSAESASSPFVFSERDGRLTLSENGKPVYVYNQTPQLPAGIPEDRRRSTYFHPVYDLDGGMVTDDFPADHLHHRGLSWMWPHVTIAGQEYNLWEMRGGVIRQVFESWLAKETGPIAAIVGIKNCWMVQDRNVMDEWVWMRVFRSGPEARVLDLALTLQPRQPVRLLGADGKGYGGLCFRFAPRDCTVITSADGLESSDSNDRRPVWADLSANYKASGHTCGVTIMQASANPDAPAEWCLRHYGFLGVSWPGLIPVTLPADKPVTMAFRIVIHRNKLAPGSAEEWYRNFTGMANVKIEEAMQ
jgi:hypothetical protein